MSDPTKSTFLWDNILTNTMISNEDIDSIYPCSNLIDENISTIARTDTETGTIAWLIDLTVGNSTPYNTIAIAGSNLTSSGAINLRRSSDAASGSWLHPTTQDNGTCIYYWDDPSTLRFIEFNTVQTTGDGYHEIGEMWVGMRYECLYNPQIPMRIIRKSNEVHHTTGGGQVWSYNNYTQCGYDLKFINDVTPVMYASLEEIFDDRGFAKPFFFNLAPTDSNDKVFFAHMEKFDFSIDGKDKRPGTITIVEEK